ncbi:MAG: hypothetical protein ABW168_28640 [Sedimenticola sp.]
MARLEKICNVPQGFNFQKDNHFLVGHITSLKIGDKDFKKDLAVTVPTDIGGDKVKVVGVSSYLYWGGGHTEEIILHCRISIDNKVVSAVLLYNEMSDTTVEFTFAIYEYDPKKKKFFLALHTNEIAIKGLVSKNEGDLRMIMNMEQEGDVTSPKNFTLNLAVMPSEEEQEVHVAADISSKFVKRWGVTVAE